MWWIFICCLFLSASDQVFCAKASQTYENFDDNPALDKQMKKLIRPYLLPLDHSMKEPLDAIFSASRAIENEEAFAEAGFEVLFMRPASFICVARHPLLPGYLLKVYLDNQTRQREGFPGWRWLVNRCKGAENIRKLIKKKNIQYFSVPDKWIYPLPVTSGECAQPVILIVTDMNLASAPETRNAWRNATMQQLDELFCILSHGYASTEIITNIPYSKDGKFTCIDTEHPKRKLKYSHIRPHLSEPMKAYWEELTKRKG